MLRNVESPVALYQGAEGAGAAKSKVALKAGILGVATRSAEFDGNVLRHLIGIGGHDQDVTGTGLGRVGLGDGGDHDRRGVGDGGGGRVGAGGVDASNRGIARRDSIDLPGDRGIRCAGHGRLKGQGLVDDNRGRLGSDANRNCTGIATTTGMLGV